MSAQRTVDWFRVIWDLVQRGHKLTAIASATGIAHSTLRSYLAGAEPAHRRGELLLRMWVEATGMERADVPLADVVLTPKVIGPRDRVTLGDDVRRKLDEALR